MKKYPMILAAAGLSISLVSASFADAENACKGKQEKQARMEKMLNRLDLSEEQRVAIAELSEKHRQERKAMRQANKRTGKMTASPDHADYQEQVEAFAKQKAASVEARIIGKAGQRAEIYALLTPEQQTQLLQLRAEKREERAEKRRKRRNSVNAGE